MVRAPTLLVRGMLGALPRGLVGLLDQRAVRGIGVTAIGVGVPAVASGRIAARRRGVSTVGVRVAADRAGVRAAVADLVLLRLSVALVVARGVAFLTVAAGGPL